MLLAGDIGGTKTHLALYDQNRQQIREKKFPSKDYPNLTNIVQEFIESEKIEKACFGIAGPVTNNTCHATNLPWDVKADALSKILGGAPVTLINDLVANAYGIRVLKSNELHTLNPGSGTGNQALVSAGTGLGEAGMYFDGKEHHPFPSEGGHADFAPRNPQEVDLYQFLAEKFGHVSYERILSGPGVANLHSFIIQKDTTLTPQEISEKALENSCSDCVAALDLFASIYGAECGNVALKYMATGGIYLGGGIAPKSLPFLSKTAFLKSFTQKGRLNSLLQNIPIYIILNPNTALLGAASKS